MALGIQVKDQLFHALAIALRRPPIPPSVTHSLPYLHHPRPRPRRLHSPSTGDAKNARTILPPPPLLALYRRYPGPVLILGEG